MVPMSATTPHRHATDATLDALWSLTEGDQLGAAEALVRALVWTCQAQVGADAAYRVARDAVSAVERLARP